MSTLTDLLAEHTKLPGGDVDHLQMVVAEWQLLSDLSFADLLMWVPLDRTTEFLCVAQARATTGADRAPRGRRRQRVAAPTTRSCAGPSIEGRICRDEDPRWHLGCRSAARRSRCAYDDRVIAVLSRETDLAVPRVPSSLEIAYLGIAADLCQMVADGSFPPRAAASDVHTQPARRRRR